MSSPLISFIVPVYCSMDYLEQCVASVLNQTISDFELILVDDGSPDESGELCDSLSASDSRIRVIHQKNGGQGAARNRGIQAATGEWLCFVDNDDWLDEDTLLSTFNTGIDTEVDIVVFGKRDVFDNGKAIKSKNFNGLVQKNTLAWRSVLLGTLNLYFPAEISFSGIPHITPWGKLIRREFAQQINFQFVHSFGEDRPALLKAYYNVSNILYVDNNFYNYRVRQASTMRKYYANVKQRYAPSITAIHEFVAENFSRDAQFLEQLMLVTINYMSYIVMQDFVHKDNPNSYPKRKNDFLLAMEDFPYKLIPKQMNLQTLPIRRKILAKFICKRNFLAIEIMAKFNQIYLKFFG